MRPRQGKLGRLRSRQAVSEAVRNGYEVETSWIPIEPRAVTLNIDCEAGVACKRRQFPLMQASAITLHKSQAGTYSSIVYDYSKMHPHKVVYAALSRCTYVNNLYLTNTKGDHRFHHKDRNEDKGTLSEFRRLEQHRWPTEGRAEGHGECDDGRATRKGFPP
ncbi:hypothetical protein HPB50_006990 [Hyalomma asiaticum]|uniref:Uncharacterized protein n=1 Tax=Hyalomma asiaticum TaxID=266040 RepID=A0ACB7SNR0_HYAAI|nr:hypothetical protein HPB50_006990 [Hyalomma asiaticum]